MLSGVEWGEYRIGDLFEVLSYKKRFDANKVTLHSSGHPYIVRTSVNNGCKGYLQEDEAYLNEGNTLSFGQDTATVFYQERPYFTGDKIKILKCKDGRFKKEIAPFFISTIDRAFSSFSWGSSSFSEKAIKAQLISLPTRDGGIDFMFMERFVAELKAQRVAELKAYLAVTGLSDYTLTPEEQQAIQHFQEDNLQWRDYRLTSVFEVKNAGNILSSEVVAGSGSTPYLCASRENNAVSSYVSYKDEMLSEGNCIFIGGKTFVVTYQEKDFFSNDSHNLILRLYEAEHRTKRKQLYLTTCIDKSLRHRYSWGDSISNKKIQTDKVTLPTNSDKPDYTQMETFIRAIEKLVIRDVVLYADRELAATQQVINQ